MLRKTFSVKKIYTICFLAFMLIMGIVPMFSFFKESLPRTIEKNSNTYNVSFSELYPFEDDGTETTSIDQKPLGLLGKYLDIAQTITNKTEQYLTSNNSLSHPFMGLPKVFLDLMYGCVIENGDNPFVQLPNGYLAGCVEYSPSSESIESIRNLSTWLLDSNIPYLTLITPDKADDSITEYPSFISHGYTRMLNEYKDFLNDNNIQYIDSKQVLLAENDDFYSWFYHSDHHWNVNAAFRMAFETATVVNNEINVTTDASALNKNNFDLVTYPDSFLGGFGKKLGYAWEEDMEVLYPKAETKFHIEIPSEGIDKTGCFEDTLIDQSHLGETSSYRAFLYGDYPLINIENMNCDSNTRVLVIGYSFANPLCTYFSNSVHYLDLIDPRCFDGSIQSYIEQTSPDIVIFCSGVVL